MCRPVDNAKVLAFVDKLKAAGWDLVLHMKLQGGSLYQYRSAADSRITVRKRLDRRQGTKVIWIFADDNVDVEPDSKDILVEATDFPTLDDLALAAVKHDTALENQREWDGAGDTAVRRATA